MSSSQTGLTSALARASARVRAAVLSLDRNILGGAALLFALFLVMEPILFVVRALPREVYDAPSIFGAALFSSPAFAAGCGLSLLAFSLAPRRAWWRLPPPARRFWLPAAVAVLAVTWHLTTLEFNWALDRSFAPDRVLLAALAVASVMHPAFLAAFVVAAHAFTGQLNIPPMRFSWLDTNVLFHVMLAVFLWTTLHDLRVPRRLAASGRLHIPAGSGWALLLGVFGAWYFLPALGKMRIGWLQNEETSNLFFNVYEQFGWLGFLDPALHLALGQWIDRLSPLLQLIGVLTETVVILLFVSRRITIGILAMCLSMHLMIFGMTGILFWKWAVVLAAIIFVFARIGRENWRRAFPRATMLTATASIIVIYALVGARPSILAWYDSALVYRFTMEATGESGTRYELMPAQLGPYDSRFVQSRFYFLTDTPRLVDGHGALWNLTAYRAIGEAETKEEILAVIDEHGAPEVAPEKRAALADMLARFLDATHEYPGGFPMDLRPVKAPQHLWAYQRRDAALPRYHFQEPLDSLSIHLVQRHRQGDRYVVISEERGVLVVGREPRPAGGRSDTRSLSF